MKIFDTDSSYFHKQYFLMKYGNFQRKSVLNMNKFGEKEN